MAALSGRTPRSTSTQVPRRVTQADAPLLGDRVKEVWRAGFTDRSGWETVAYVAALVALLVAGSIVRESHLPVGTIVVSVTLATALLIAIRFRN